MTIEIQLTRKSIMALVEGISITISQHNGGKPTYEQLWASDSESPKLDIYYRESISDLESAITKYIVQSTAKFDLQAAGSDYSLKLSLAQSWPQKLTGVLSNKIQDFLVHAVTAGWLNDFDGLDVKNDYKVMAADDISEIQYLCSQKTFFFTEHVRNSDDASGTEANGTASMRAVDDQSKPQTETQESASARVADSGKDLTGEVEATGRATDSQEKTADEGTAVERAADNGKDLAGVVEASERTADGQEKSADEDTAAERTADTGKGNDEQTQNVVERNPDDEKSESPTAAVAGRATDVGKDEAQAGEKATARTSDDLDKAAREGTASERQDDEDSKTQDLQGGITASERNKDDATVDLHKDYTNWGTPPFLCHHFRGRKF